MPCSMLKQIIVTAMPQNSHLLDKEMFRDSSIAQSCTSWASKLAYIIKYGLAEYFKEQVQLDSQRVPYTFTFDETKTCQVKKQFDVLVTYYSKVPDGINSNYLDSVFVGHCYPTDYVDHYNTFKEHSKWILTFYCI